MFRRVGDKFIVETGDMPKIIHSSNKGILWSKSNVDSTTIEADRYYASIDVLREPNAFTKIWMLYWKFKDGV